VKFWTQIS